MNPPFTDVSAMTITSAIHIFLRVSTARSRAASHPEALQERQLNIPRRIDEPATAARLVASRCTANERTSRSRYIWTIVTVSSVTPSLQRAGIKPSAFWPARLLPGLQPAATGCLIIHNRRYRLPSATEEEELPSAP